MNQNTQWLLVVSWAEEYSVTDISVNRPTDTALRHDKSMKIDYQRMSIGARLRLRRKELKLTQVQLAAISGIEQGTVSDLERGKTKEPAGSTLAGICRALQTSDRWILEGKGEPSMVVPRNDAEEDALTLFKSLTSEEQELWLTLGEAIRQNRRPPGDDQPQARRLLS